MLSVTNSGKSAPKWFRKFKKIWSNTENTVIGLLLIMGYASEAPLLLVIKITSSYVLNNLDTLLGSDEEIKIDKDSKPD